jgi:hypothetical protein
LSTRCEWQLVVNLFPISLQQNVRLKVDLVIGVPGCWSSHGLEVNNVVFR